MIRRLRSFTNEKYVNALSKMNRFEDIDESIWKRKIILDIGFGSGEITIHRLLNENNIIVACDPFLSGVIKLSNKLKEKNDNLYVYSGIVENIIDLIPDLSVYEVMIIHPDPWPKKRHHKRRIINDIFVKQLYRITNRVIIATDSLEYLEYINEKMSLMFMSEDFVHCWPQSKYSSRYESKYVLWNAKRNY